jgi:ribosome-binding protein aMBF1 (putative translation factor)
MNKLNKKLSELASSETSNWKEKAQYRRNNREWLKRSSTIAIKVLDALKAQGLTQKDLAERLDVSPQYINKIVKGEENLTLETITNLELALGIQIIISDSDKKSAA